MFLAHLGHHSRQRIQRRRVGQAVGNEYSFFFLTLSLKKKVLAGIFNAGCKPNYISMSQKGEDFAPWPLRSASQVVMEVTGKCRSLNVGKRSLRCSFPLSECIVLRCLEGRRCWPYRHFLFLAVTTAITYSTDNLNLFILVCKQKNCKQLSSLLRRHFGNASIVCSTLLMGNNSTSQITCELWGLLIALGILIFSFPR